MSGRDTSFYYSFLVLPPRKRHAIIAVWDFCRAVDDAVDEIADGAATAVRAGSKDLTAAGPCPEAHQLASDAIADWRKELEAVYSGTPRTPQGIALQPFVRAFNLPRGRFDELIDGVAMDLTRARYDTFDELREYCLRVASAVGLICVEIFGYRDPGTREYAVNLGMALQLTNIIRDVAADLERGRVYLPIEDLVRFHVTEAELRGGRLTQRMKDLLRFECARARAYYERAAAALPPCDARRLVAAEIMGAIYYAILRRVERSGYDVFTERIRVPRPRRAVIALWVWAKTMVRAARSDAARQEEGDPKPG